MSHSITSTYPKNMKALTTLVLTFCLTLGLHAQERNVQVKIKSTPERNWSQYKKIIIAEFEGPDGSVTARSLDISDYVAQTFVKAGEFKVYDRNNLPRILSEQKKQLSGVFDEETTLKAGKLIGADLMISARVQMDDFSQDDKGVWIPVGKNGSVLPTTKGTYVLAVAFKLFNVSTGETVDQFVRDIILDGRSKIGHSSVTEVNDAPIKREALEKFAQRFSCDLAPCTVEETIKFVSDPSFNKEMDLAIRHFNVDEPEEAVALLKSIHDRENLKENARHKAQFNYGLILLAQGRCHDARDLFKKAYMANGKAKNYLEAFEKAKAQCADNGNATGASSK